MSNVFNTSFEISLRMALLFGACKGSLTADRAAAYDFVTIYSSSFSLSDKALNGENDYGFSEFTVRREIVIKALKDMVVNGLMAVRRDNSGFKYVLTSSGTDFDNSLNTEYATEYRELARITAKAMHDIDDVKLFELITRESTKSLRR